MTTPYIAIIGTYDSYTSERVVYKEIKVDARDHYSAHKVALYKCNVKEDQMVLQILDYNDRTVLFDVVKGFN